MSQKILVIEDDKETANYVKQGLEEQGHVVDLASTGRDGLFLAAGETYDIIIVDRRLPGIDGLSIVKTIREEYDWETAEDTTTTWRIGDGTAPFYNYIYQTIAGFTEDEVMLANMIREGHIDRDEALRRAYEYGKPRWPSIREYAQLIGFSAEEALQVINAAPKLY